MGSSPKLRRHKKWLISCLLGLICIVVSYQNCGKLENSGAPNISGLTSSASSAVGNPTPVPTPALAGLTFSIQNTNSGLCLDSGNQANGTNLIQATCSGSVS